MQPGLRIAAAYAWRVLVVGALFWFVFLVARRFVLIAVAVFAALVLTALLRPLVGLLARAVPRTLAVLCAFVIALVLLAGLLSLVGNSVAGESGRLSAQFRGGVHQIETWLERAPFHVSPGTLTGLQGKITAFLSAHRSVLISHALSSASQAVEVITGVALALFCSVFFIHSGEAMWRFVGGQLPAAARDRWDRAGRAGWRAFAGYTRGLIIVAATNAVMVGIALHFLQVPLALPLTLLVFLASFVPLVGSPIALAVATVVALASRGPLTAAVVLGLIVVIGQIEGHLLHPLVMSWAVRLHPVVVAVSVLAGTTVAGVVGAVVAVPAVSVLWAVIRELRARPEPG
ncbi:AI-2E family transporter [Streptacidiphilus sp. EB129]|uniref:AI-2E family transporter n=1 Tax=Streptacidiphilus sp. EB129 TaxID=3156262 RepID=UPI003518E430